MSRQNSIKKLRKIHNIILFDGLCNLCDASVRFIIKRTSQKRFLYIDLNSEVSKYFLKSNDIFLLESDSIFLITSNEIYTKSSAVLKIFKELTGLWWLLSFFLVFPKFIRDPIYNFIAKKRYKWSGKKTVCRTPSPEELDCFI